ncbi:MAG: hypothetical protein AB7I13_03325 [Vicinamibacterales bacterium]
MRAWLPWSLAAGLVLGSSAAASAQQVNLTLDDGYVTLTTKDATIRQVLAEWARVGQTRVVNADRIAGVPITVQLIRIPEAEALDILLRSTSGYMAAPRATALPNASRFDRILVMPPSTAPRVMAAAQPAPQTFQPPTADDDFDTADPAMNDMPPSRGPVFPQFPGGPGGPGNPGSPAQMQRTVPAPIQQPGGTFPQAGPFPQPTPFPVPVAPSQGFTPPPVNQGGMPVGVSTPGMMVMPPQTSPGASPNEPPQ